MNMTEVYGWHFLPADRQLRFGDNRLVKVGETLRVEGEIAVAARGLHASRRAIDALVDAPGPIVCHVRLGGQIVESPPRLAASERTVLAMADATALLHEFACWCAESVLHLAGDGEAACRAAIAAKRAWLKGEATDQDLAYAWDAAMAAARAAARDAAMAAASASQHAELERRLFGLINQGSDK